MRYWTLLLLLCGWLCRYTTVNAQISQVPARDSIEVVTADSVVTNVMAAADTTVTAIVADTTITVAKEATAFKPNPTKAVWLALIPGMGQIYNRKYWKLPIVYGGLMGCMYAVTWNNKNYQDYSEAYRDIMYDAALAFAEQAQRKSRILQDLQLTDKPFCLCTFHREENTDDATRLTQICQALEAIAAPDRLLVFPLHPRTRRALSESGWLDRLASNPSLRFTAPLGFLDMVMLEKQATLILTDSGGVQKEAYFHRTPCITLRQETEWTETVASGWNQLAGYETERILACLRNQPTRREIAEYGDGQAAQKILRLL